VPKAEGVLVCRCNVLGVKELVLSKSEDICYGALNESVFYALLRRGVRRVAARFGTRLARG
jgi:hypothetical protein